LANIGGTTRIHRSIFPIAFSSIFPGTNQSETDFIYTTFAWAEEGLMPYKLDLKNENPDFVKRYFNRLIHRYFRLSKNQIVKQGFIKENQVWLALPVNPTSQYWEFERFSLLIKLAEVSAFPEIHLSFDGNSKVLKSNIVEAIKTLSPENFNWVLYQGQVVRYSKMIEWQDVNLNDAFPVVGKSLRHALGIPSPIPPKINRYTRYLGKVKSFHQNFLNNQEFQQIIPLNKSAFISVTESRISKTAPESNQLRFGSNGTDVVPYSGISKHGPFKKPSFSTT